MKQRSGNRGVAAGRDTDRSCVNFETASRARGETGIEIVKDARGWELHLKRLSAGRVAFHKSGEAGVAEIANDAKMIAAENAGADDDVIDRLGHTQRPALPSTTWRQRV